LVHDFNQHRERGPAVRARQFSYVRWDIGFIGYHEKPVGDFHGADQSDRGAPAQKSRELDLTAFAKFLTGETGEALFQAGCCNPERITPYRVRTWPSARLG
jgi:hypothetical protein